MPPNPCVEAKCRDLRFAQRNVEAKLTGGQGLAGSPGWEKLMKLQLLCGYGDGGYLDNTVVTCITKREH